MNQGTRRRFQCDFCGHLHGQTMVKRVHKGGRVVFRAAHVEGAKEWRARRDAEFDQCEAWAAEKEGRIPGETV